MGKKVIFNLYANEALKNINFYIIFIDMWKSPITKASKYKGFWKKNSMNAQNWITDKKENCYELEEGFVNS